MRPRSERVRAGAFFSFFALFFSFPWPHATVKAIESLVTDKAVLAEKKKDFRTGEQVDAEITVVATEDLFVVDKR